MSQIVFSRNTTKTYDLQPAFLRTLVSERRAYEHQKVLAISGGNEARNPQQRTLGFRVWKICHGEAGSFGVSAGGVHGVVDRAVAVQNLKNLRMRNAIEAAISQHGADSFAIGTSPALERMDHSQRGLAFAQIAGHRLAQDIFSSREVKNVIDNLKGKPKIAPVFAKLCFEFVRVAEAMCQRDRRAELHRNLEQTRGLA